MASGSSTLASSGAAQIAGHIANLTSSLVNQLPPSVQTTIDSASQYIESTTGVNPSLFYSSAAAAALLLGAIPTVYARSTSSRSDKDRDAGGKKMSRYGWSSGRDRDGLSPFNSSLGRDGVPAVTDDDYSYITSEDLEKHGVEGRDYKKEPVDRSRHYTRSTGGPSLVIDEDDILLIKNKGITYPEHFPAYSIGDGKLLVGDVRERAQMVMKLSDRKARKIKLLYKGRQLKIDDEPICEFGVKNNSEIMVVHPDGGDDDSSTESSEEVVVVGSKDAEGGRSKKSKSGKKRRSKKKDRSSTSPRDSGGLEVPRNDGAGASRPQSPASGVSGGSAAAAPGGPIDKLNTIKSHFTTQLLPLCLQYTANPPSDRKKSEDEHRKLSETVMQQVLLKLDEVETNGDEDARAKRKELVRMVQDVLKGLDDAKGS